MCSGSSYNYSFVIGKLGSSPMDGKLQWGGIQICL